MPRPPRPSPLRDLALGLHRAGDLAGAERLYDLLLGEGRPDAELLYLVGLLRFQAGRPAEALAPLRRALRMAPRDGAAWALTGLAEAALGRPTAALAAYDRSLAARPDHWEVLANRALALGELGRAAEALASVDRSVARRPDVADVHANRGRILLALGRPGEALAAGARALALAPGHAGGHGAAAAALDALDDPLGALGALPDPAPAASLRAEAAAVLDRRAVALAEAGRLDEAAAALDRAIAAAPGEPALYRKRGLFRPHPPGHPHHAALAGLLAAEGRLSDDRRIELRFALADAAAEAGDPKGAFAHLVAGNALKRATIDYDPETLEALLRRIRAAFPPGAAPAGAEREREAAPRPVFIVGVPRSGSTLAERIVAAHPLAFAAGEADAFRRALEDLPVARPGSYPEAVAGLSADELAHLGAGWRALLPGVSAGTACVVDKTLVNLWHVGLIRLALPGARFVFAVRDPVDTALSCFAQLFDTPVPFAYDLAEIGRYQAAAAGAMAHWRGALPAGEILELRHEALVADPEGQARRLVAHCGLPWDDACLRPELVPGPVRTASLAQVRRPIGALRPRWRPPEGVLRPLREALGGDPGGSG